MNRYPLWKYLVILVALIIGSLYTLPNFFGESPAVQISPAKSSFNIDTSVLARVQEAMTQASLTPSSTNLDVGHSLKVGFERTEDQLRAKDLIQKTLNSDLENPSYILQKFDLITNINN